MSHEHDCSCGHEHTIIIRREETPAEMAEAKQKHEEQIRIRGQFCPCGVHAPECAYHGKKT